MYNAGALFLTRRSLETTPNGGVISWQAKRTSSSGNHAQLYYTELYSVVK
ncbi:hypothetical protein TRIP_D300210 [uncultured Paludibacter sp.]|nr:hypothetical protein TRIP_D300210 [uncultured Paludibacter sp.]